MSIRELLIQATGVAGQSSFLTELNEAEDNIGGGLVVAVAALGAFKGILVAYSGAAPALVATFGVAGTVGIVASGSVISLAVGCIAAGAVCIAIDVFKAPRGTFFVPEPTPLGYLKRASHIVSAPFCSALFTVEQFLKCIQHVLLCLWSLCRLRPRDACTHLRMAGDAMIKMAFNVAAIPLFPLINLIDLVGAAIKHVRNPAAAKVARVTPAFEPHIDVAIHPQDETRNFRPGLSVRNEALD